MKAHLVIVASTLIAFNSAIQASIPYEKITCYQALEVEVRRSTVLDRFHHRVDLQIARYLVGLSWKLETVDTLRAQTNFVPARIANYLAGFRDRMRHRMQTGKPAPTTEMLARESVPSEIDELVKILRRAIASGELELPSNESPVRP